MKPGPDHTPEGGALTELILTAYHLHGPLVRVGDDQSRKWGLSAARWQLLSIIAEAPASMADLGRSLGLRRQAIRSTVTGLLKDGFVEFIENEHHRRAQLVRITQSGLDVLEALRLEQTEWANSVAEGFSLRDLERATRTLEALKGRLRDR